MSSIFGKEGQHPNVASSWNEVGLALNARESFRPIFFCVHLHVDDPGTDNWGVKCLERGQSSQVIIHTRGALRWSAGRSRGVRWGDTRWEIRLCGVGESRMPQLERCSPRWKLQSCCVLYHYHRWHVLFITLCKWWTWWSVCLEPLRRWWAPPNPSQCRRCGRRAKSHLMFWDDYSCQTRSGKWWPWT